MFKRNGYINPGHGRFGRWARTVKARKVFPAVMVLSLVALFLPLWLTESTEKFGQAWLAPTSRFLILAGRKVNPSRSQSTATEGGLTDKQLDRLFTTLYHKLEDLEAENRSLMGIRKQVGPSPILVPAHVVGFDSAGLPSFEIDRGTESGIREGLPVLAGIPLDILQSQSDYRKLALSAGVVVGTIGPAVGPYTSRVKLITALETGKLLAGRIVRFDPDQNKTHVVAPVQLQGTGKGLQLKADMVPERHKVQPGDFVIPAEPEKLNLPVPVVLGVVEKIEPNKEHRIFVDLTIRPFFEKIRLSKVYVLVPRDSTGSE